jgi:hypothetical protein
MRRNENMPNGFSRCLTVSIRPLRVEELAEILAVQFDESPLRLTQIAPPENAEEAVIVRMFQSHRHRR